MADTTFVAHRTLHGPKFGVNGLVMLQRFAAAMQFLKLFEMLMSALAIRPRSPMLRGYFKVRVSLTILVGLLYRCLYVCQ